jgi:sugar O-acyltransferase (sialic acid O-acetyltransferase NeuD family)
MRDLVIVGAGGHGREVLDVVEAINRTHPTWRVAGFLDDGAPALDRLERRGVTWRGDTEMLATLDESVAIAVAIGDGGARRAVAGRLAHSGHTAVTLVHPGATVGGDNRLAAGVLIAAGCHVTTNVTIGAHSHLNVATLVHHDCVLGAFVTLSPGVIVNGDVALGDDVWIGPGAVIGRGVTVAKQAVIGAGAVVLDDVPEGDRVAGVPARTIGGHRR